MTMDITIRKATIDDIANILDIVNYSILHTTANYNYEVQSKEVQTQWFLDKQSKGFPVLVADFDGSAVGFSTYGTFREKIGYQFTVEHSVYVAQEYIGKGIGRILLTSLIELAKAEGYHTMIGGIDASNKGSIEFHKKFGFVESGVIKEAGFKFDRWLDLMFMQLIL